MAVVAADIMVSDDSDLPQSPDRQYKAPKHYTKLEKILKSPDRVLKAPRDYTKTDINIRQNHAILNTNFKS